MDSSSDGYGVVKVRDHYEVINPRGKVYFLREQEDGTWRCTCPAFQFHGACKHQAMIPSAEPKRFDRAVMARIIEIVVPVLMPIAERIEIAGSYRRERLTCKDLDILVQRADGILCIDDLLTEFAGSEWQVKKAGNVLVSGHLYGIPVDFTGVSRTEEWPFALLYRTGSKEHNIMMRGRAKRVGLKLNEKGLWYPDGRSILCETEADVYHELALDYCDPIIR